MQLLRMKPSGDHPWSSPLVLPLPRQPIPGTSPNAQNKGSAHHPKILGFRDLGWAYLAAGGKNLVGAKILGFRDQPVTAPPPVLCATTSRKNAQNASKMPNRDPKSRYLRNGAHIIDRLKSAIFGRFRASRGSHGAQRAISRRMVKFQPISKDGAKF